MTPHQLTQARRDVQMYRRAGWHDRADALEAQIAQAKAQASALRPRPGWAERESSAHSAADNGVGWPGPWADGPRAE